MASSLPSFYAIVTPSFKHCIRQPLQVRAQSCRDGGRSSDRVDENLSVLRERIEQVKIKEKLERCCRCEYGWNYAAGYNYKAKRDGGISEFFELVRLVGITLGFTCLTGTVFLCLVSLFVHLNQ
ncbi:uncharacterized protein LOC110426074 [Herrania umbratica]|uniref:Uncharacterized protein LOC110426074 n=1 Tax=Herrania umbratica TaxID=108875 RepID=A0A6J1BBT1_9ROSI|nr:uncharacterized protein LOC110426074 [Herrania umbratica]